MAGIGVAGAVLLAGCTSSVTGTPTAAGPVKPSESELHSSMVDDLIDNGFSEEDAVALSDCAAPLLHEELSAASLNAILEDGVIGADVDDDDFDAGEAILEKCVDEVGLW